MILNISVKNNKIVNRIASTTTVMRIGLCLTVRVLCSWMGFGDWQEDSSEWSLPTWILVLYCAKALQTLPIIERELGRVLQLQCHSGLELRLKKKKIYCQNCFQLQLDSVIISSSYCWGRNTWQRQPKGGEGYLSQFRAVVLNLSHATLNIPLVAMILNHKVTFIATL